MLKIKEPSPLLLIEDLGRLYPTEKSKHKSRFGIYKCTCGVEFKTQTQSVRNGSTRSCGCLKYGTHNMSWHRLYKTWRGMVDRTTKDNHSSYLYYKLKGIKVCDRWLDINNFIDDMYPTYQDGLSIDRIDNNGNYEPSNCRWANNAVQKQNRGIPKNNKSGYKGVSFIRKSHKWLASIGFNGKNKGLGTYDTPIEAAIAYNNYADMLGMYHVKNIL